MFEASDPVKDTKVDNKHPGRRYRLIRAEPSKSIPWHPDYTLKVFEALDPANDINMNENHPGRLNPTFKLSMSTPYDH